MDCFKLKDSGFVPVGEITPAEVTGGFCGDLLSWVMSRAKKGDVWFTVIGNINTLAVASLVEMSAVVLCHGVQPDGEFTAKAAEQRINVFTTDEPVFESAAKLAKLLAETK